MWQSADFYQSPSAKRRSARLIPVVVLLLLGLALASGVRAVSTEQDYGRKISKNRKGLSKVESRLNRQKRKAKKMEKEENDILYRLTRLNKAIDTARKSLKEIRSQLKEKTSASIELTDRLNELEDSFQIRKDVIASRLIGLYKSRRLGYGNLIWSSADFPQFWRRYKLIKQITTADARLFENLKSDYHDISMQKAALEKAKWEISHKEQEQKKTLRELKNAKGDKNKLLRSVRRRQKVYLQAVEELEAAAKKMKTLITSLRKQQKNALDSQYGASPVYLNKSRLPWPTGGAVAREFGRQKHPEFGTYYDYQGIDIIAARGQPVKAVADGVVRYADWFRGYGKVIIIDHNAGFFTLYGHLSEMKVANGAEVKMNQIIGAVGDTGSINGAYLYFEIRQNGHQVNPRQWLSKK